MPRTTIALEAETRDRLKALGRKGESYEDILNRLIDRFLGIEAPARPAPPGRVDERAAGRPKGKSAVDFERVR